MKREFNWSLFWFGFRTGLFQVSCVAVIIGVLLLIFGCTPHVARIDVTPERVDEPKQNVHDLQWPCERCGDVATENVSEVADEQNWRCDKCKPRDVMPRLQRKQKLERQWVMR